MKVIKHKDRWYLQSDTGYKEILLSTDTELQKDGYKIIIPKEPKQETLEEAAEKFVNNTRYRNYKVLFIEGAKWQAERIGLMEIELRHTKTLLASCEKALEDRDKQAERGYSEEEVKSAFKIGFNIGYGSPVSELDLKQQHCDRWFEKHKKK